MPAQYSGTRVSGQHHTANTGLGFGDPFRHRDTVHPGHLHVEHRDIGCVPRRRVQRRLTGRDEPFVRRFSRSATNGAV
jgi:hypothetical protein